MKLISFVAALTLAATSAASAQEAPTAPLSRGDIHFVVGWQNLHKEQPLQHYNDWVNGILFGGAGGGWYWTDHLKTQVDIGGGTTGHQYRYETIIVNGQTTSSSSRVGVRDQSVAIAQQYQFFRNRWFHPYVAAGADVARETTTEEYQAVVVYDSITRTSRLITPPRTEGPEHRTVARPFGAAGFKAYLTQRAFFTADTRVMFKSGLDEILFRFGFGVDF